MTLIRQSFGCLIHISNSTCSNWISWSPPSNTGTPAFSSLSHPWFLPSFHTPPPVCQESLLSIWNLSRKVSRIWLLSPPLLAVTQVTATTSLLCLPAVQASQCSLCCHPHLFAAYSPQSIGGVPFKCKSVSATPHPQTPRWFPVPSE